MQRLMDQLNETVAFIRTRTKTEPETAIVLGSGLGNFLNEVSVETAISYSDIPHFPVATVEGHEGKLVFGELNGRRIVAMAGRFHYYEGYSPQEVVYPVRLMKLLGFVFLLLLARPNRASHSLPWRCAQCGHKSDTSPTARQ